MYVNRDTGLTLTLAFSSNKQVACVFSIVSVLDRLHDWLFDALGKSHSRFAVPFGGRLWLLDSKVGSSKCLCYCDYFRRKDKLWVRCRGRRREEREIEEKKKIYRRRSVKGLERKGIKRRRGIEVFFCLLDSSLPTHGVM